MGWGHLFMFLRGSCGRLPPKENAHSYAMEGLKFLTSSYNGIYMGRITSSSGGTHCSVHFPAHSRHIYVRPFCFCFCFCFEGPFSASFHYYGTAQHGISLQFLSFRTGTNHTKRR